MNNHMSLKLVGANSSLELNSPITSIYLQEELTGLTTLPGIRETKGMNIGMDGGWTSAQFYEPRLITIKGVIANQDVAVVEQRRKQLIQLLAEKRLALEFQTEAGNHYTMDVVVAGVQMPLSKVLTASYFQISLRADDPLIYDNNALAELEAILRRSSSASSGFSINFPINFQLGTSESRPTIDNFGSSVIYPVITLTGPLTTPEIVNITTNMAFTIDEVLGAGTYTASGIRGAMTQEGSVDTYSGNPIQATRDAESPISKFSLYGNAEQTTYSGKNLFNKATAMQGYRLGSDGSAFSDADYYVSAFIPVSQNTAYYISGTSGTADSSAVCFYASDKSFISRRAFINDWYTFTTPANTAFLRFTTLKTNNIDQVQLELGSTATSYEPYVGGTASPNPDYPQAVNTTTGENVVKITGKNLFDKNNYSSTAGYFYSSDTLIATGSATHNILFWISCVGNTKYSITIPAGYGIVTKVATSLVEPANGVSVTGSYRTEATAVNGYTTSANAKYLVIYLQAQNYTIADILDDIVSQLQIELGSTATSYEPYQGQDYELNLGKNLVYQTELPKTQADVLATYNDGVFSLSGTANANSNLYILPYTQSIAHLEAGESLTYYLERVGGTSKAYFVTYFIPDDGSATDYNWQLTMDAGENSKKLVKTATKAGKVAYAQFFINNGVSYDVQVKVLVQKGNIANPTWAEYFTPIELCKIGTYQDRIYKNDGKWYVEKQVGKVVLNGTESAWRRAQFGSTGKYYYTFGASWGQQTTNGKIVLSDYFKAKNTWSEQVVGVWLDANIILTTQGSLSDSETLNDFKSWLSTHNTTVYYALATPTTTEITNQALIDQLDAILEAHLYEGINNISNVTISPNLSGDLEIKTGQTLTVINSLSIVGSSGSAEIGLGGSELAMVGSVADELTINGTTGAVTKTTRIGKIASYAGETITTDYISTSGGLDSDATIYYVLPSSSTSVINTLDSTALTAFNNVVASGGVSAQTNIGSISVDVTTVTAQDVAVVDTKQHTVTINGVGAYSKFSGDWLTLDVGLNELQLITENNTDTGSAVIKYRVGYMGV